MSLKECISCGDLLNGLVYECYSDGETYYVGYACCVRENRHGFSSLGPAHRIGLGYNKILTEDQVMAAIQSMPGLWTSIVRRRKYLDTELLRYKKNKKQL
jgi:hypothetical protein